MNGIMHQMKCKKGCDTRKEQRGAGLHRPAQNRLTGCPTKQCTVGGGTVQWHCEASWTGYLCERATPSMRIQPTSRAATFSHSPPNFLHSYVFLSCFADRLSVSIALPLTGTSPIPCNPWITEAWELIPKWLLYYLIWPPTARMFIFWVCVIPLMKTSTGGKSIVAK